jgi:hypothetical protein
MRPPGLRRLLASFLAAFSATACLAVEPPAIVPVPGAIGTNLFGGTQARFAFAVNPPPSRGDRASWVISIDRRTVARGEVEVAAREGQPGRFEVPWDVPDVKEGVIVRADLALSMAGATWNSPLWIFPRNPFAGRSSVLKNRSISLFDPEQTTARVLEATGVPFERVRNVDALAEQAGGLLIVGEGVSFRAYRALAEILIKAAARGRRVLCLAPADGLFPVPGADDPDLPAPGRLAFRDGRIIHALDKRLDDHAWPPDGQVVAGALTLKAEGGRVVAAVTPGPSGWPWLEADYPASGGKLVVCGFAIVSHWDAGPTPRHLFARILDTLDEGGGGPRDADPRD